MAKKGLFELALRLPKLVLKFCVVPVSKWYLGGLFLLKVHWRMDFSKFRCFGDLQLGLII